MYEYFLDWKIMQNATLSVDTFFVMGGIVTAYVATQKVKNIFNLKNSNSVFGVHLNLNG